MIDFISQYKLKYFKEIEKNCCFFRTVSDIKECKIDNGGKSALVAICIPR